MKIGIIREGKKPIDRRVPLTPQQCLYLKENYSNLKLVVQPSDIRAFSDKEYAHLGIDLQEDLSDCDILMGVKEVPINMLIAGKTYLFFSHTYKKQPYNRDLLRAILDKKISLIDYEMLKEPGGKRLLGFGRYAGIVGAYNAFRAYGELKGKYHIKPAHQCADRHEMEQQLVNVNLPSNFKIVLTGGGKVAMGAMEVLSALKITHVFPQEFVDNDFANEPVFTQLDVRQYFKRKDGEAFTRKEFYANSEGYDSNFLKYAKGSQMYLACHYWSEKSPFIYTREDVRHPDFDIEIVSDISADIDGPIASTLKPSTIDAPFYGYNPITEKVVSFGEKESIGVSAVDNLPCELPRDASEDFGNDLVKHIIPLLVNGDSDQILARASETDLNGNLTKHYAYLADYIG